MTGRFIQLHLALARHRPAVLLGLLLFAVAALLAGRQLKLSEDFTDILPMSTPAIAEQVAALKHIRQAERLFIDVATRTPDAARLAEAATRLTTALAELPHLTDLRGEINPADLGAAYEELQDQLPSLLTAAELRELEPRFTTGAIEKRLGWLKHAMSQPQGLMFKNVAQTDPAGISDTVAARLRALQAGAGDAKIVNGRITSADGCHVLLNAAPDFPSSDTGKSAELMAAVLEAARAVEAAFPAGDVTISVTGAHRSALDNTVMIRQDTARTTFLATAAIVALIALACRRRLLALLSLVPVIFGLLGAVAIFYFTGDLVSAVALGCGSMLISITVDYGIYILYALDDCPPADRTDLAGNIVRFTPGLVFGALTTMAAFLVMLLSPIAGHRQLGLFGLVGVGLAMGSAILILPVFIPVQRPGALPPMPLTRLVKALFDWRSRNPRIVLPAVVVFTLVCAFGVSRLTFDGDLARLNGVTAETQHDEARVRETWGQALSLTTIVVGGTNREDALQRNERVFGALQKLRGEGVFESFSSVAPLLPSAATRAANRRDWQAFWTPARQGELKNSLTTAGAVLGFRAAAFAPFLAKISSPPPTATMAADSALNTLTADFRSERDGELYFTTLVKVADVEQFRRLHAAVKADVPEAMLLNKRALSDDIAQVARRALPLFSLLVAGLNALLIFLLLGRVSLMLVTLLPMATGVLWTLGTLGLLGLPVDVANFIFVIFIVGVGGDYSLFMVLSELDALRGHPERTPTTGGAVSMCALTSLIGTGVLVLAQHPALFSVGLTALLGISYSLLATLVLVPLATHWVAGRNSRPLHGSNPKPAEKLRAVSRLYWLQGPYVSRFTYWKLKTDPLFNAVEQAVPPRGDILDIGCGFGLLAHWLTLFTPQRQVRGVDFDRRKLRTAQATGRMNPRVTFEQGDILEWPEYPACDNALLCDVLHYFPRELKREIVRKAFAALRPGGRLIVRDAMAGADAGHHAVKRSEKWGVFLGQNRTRHGLHFESKEAHFALLREAGFEPIEFRSDAGLGSNGLLVAQKPAAHR